MPVRAFLLLLSFAIVLEGCGHLKTPAFQQGAGELKTVGPYRPQAKITVEEDEADDGHEPPESAAEEEALAYEAESAFSSISEEERKKIFGEAKPAIPLPEKKEELFEIDWPVDQARLSQKFRPHGKRKGRRSKRRHQGIDLSAARGTPIYAAHKGRVVYVGNGFRGYGNMVLLEFNKTWATLYAHLDKIYVQTGQSVSRGELLGTMGRTGRSTGVHLHFEVIKDLTPIDPLEVLPQ